MHWYDRNPKSKVDEYGNTLGPHAYTARVTYVCPENKIAMVEILQCFATRFLAADSVNKVQCDWRLKPSGGSQKLILKALFHNNTVGANDDKSIGGNFMIFAGDELKAYTQDAGTGGLIAYHMSYKITEFDAEPPKGFVYNPDPTPGPDIQQPDAVKDPPM